MFNSYPASPCSHSFEGKPACEIDLCEHTSYKILKANIASNMFEINFKACAVQLHAILSTSQHRHQLCFSVNNQQPPASSVLVGCRAPCMCSPTQLSTCCSHARYAICGVCGECGGVLSAYVLSCVYGKTRLGPASLGTL